MPHVQHRARSPLERKRRERMRGGPQGHEQGAHDEREPITPGGVAVQNIDRIPHLVRSDEDEMETGPNWKDLVLRDREVKE